MVICKEYLMYVQKFVIVEESTFSNCTSKYCIIFISRPCGHK